VHSKNKMTHSCALMSMCLDDMPARVERLEDSIKALSRLCQGSIEALLRLY
jgi:hypothetical protein